MEKSNATVYVTALCQYCKEDIQRTAFRVNQSIKNTCFDCREVYQKFQHAFPNGQQQRLYKILLKKHALQLEKHENGEVSDVQLENEAGK